MLQRGRNPHPPRYLVVQTQHQRPPLPPLAQLHFFAPRQRSLCTLFSIVKLTTMSTRPLQDQQDDFFLLNYIQICSHHGHKQMAAPVHRCQPISFLSCCVQRWPSLSHETTTASINYSMDPSPSAAATAPSTPSSTSSQTVPSLK